MNTTIISNNQTTITSSIKSHIYTLAKNANLTYIALITKGWDRTRKLIFNFEGENAHLNFIAIIIGKGKDKFPLITVSNHTTKNTKARFSIRKTLFDKSEANYEGLIKIQPEAEKTDSHINSHTLLLSSNAKTSTLPSLEIEANNVKAGHSATIGKIDEEILFYLQSRGLDERNAKTLMIKGFLETDLKKTVDKYIKKTLYNKIEKSLLSTNA